MILPAPPAGAAFDGAGAAAGAGAATGAATGAAAGAAPPDNSSTVTSYDVPLTVIL